jgi:hypothetical protein
MSDDESINMEELNTHPFNRKNRLVDASLFVRPTEPPVDVLAGIPDILAGRDFKRLCGIIAEASASDREVVWAMGAHVIKVGLSLLVIDLMKRGIITAVAMNGAGAIHDWEMARGRATSEDVGAGLDEGTFGMCHETAQALNDSADQAAQEEIGFGEALGRQIEQADYPGKDFSILAAGFRLGIPITIHVSIGSDIVHMHAGADGASIGAASMKDFRRLIQITAGLEGGVWLNIGSSVVLPEVFLKALTVARNLKGQPRHFSTADLDMIRHYRPVQNVVRRPGGRGMAITGHHEILIPLLRWGVIWKLERKGTRRIHEHPID